ncbi:MAG: NAD-dependent epimerase/dehydratase family protein [Methylomicrobium sp.]
MKIAITGATGFIGRHVISQLTKKSDDFVTIVRTLDKREVPLPKDKVLFLDIHTPPINAYELMGCPDVLIHLAWGGLPNYKSLHHFETELPAHYRFLKELIQSGLQSLVITGTCFEYGMQSGPLSENLPSRPYNPYGYAKDALRQQLEYLKIENTFNLTWLRLFYTYGAGQGPTSLYSQLCTSVARGDKTFNMSGGEQLRDYLHVSDVASSIVDLALQARDCGIINICSGKPVSIRKLVEGWIHENGWNIELDLGRYPYPEYEPMAFWGTRYKLNSYLIC